MGIDTRVSAAVLAGGKSSRMGTDKALIDVEGEALVCRVVHRLEALSDDVVIVSKAPLPVDALGGVPEVLDELEEHTPLSGIITALHAARHPQVFVCACDMPFVSPELVGELVSAGRDADAAVPRNGDRLEVLHAVWSDRALRKLERCWEDGERSVRGALDALDVRFVDGADPAVFTNVNTPGDLAALRAAPRD